MKYFLALALVAVAGAVSPVRLMKPVLFEEAVYAPEELKKVPMPVKVVDAPEISEAAVGDVNAYAIKVVDEAVNADAVATVADLKSLLKPVQLEEAVYAPLMLPEEAKDAVMPVKVVDAPEISEAAVGDVNAYAIKVVDEAVNADAVATVADLKSLLKPVQLEEAVYAPLMLPEEAKDAVMPVKVVDAPEISEAAVEDVNAYAIKVVDEAVNADAVATVADLKSLLKPVQLEEAVYAPLILPEEAKDAVMPVKVVDAPEISEAAVGDVNAYAIKVVDEAVNADAVATVADLKSLLKPVQLEEAVYAPLMLPEEAKDAVMAVKVVDAPEVSEAVDTNAYAVKIVEEAINDAEAPVVNFIHAPLPNSVVLPLAATVALPSIHPAMVLVDEESPSYIPLELRRYPDATWR